MGQHIKSTKLNRTGMYSAAIKLAWLGVVAGTLSTVAIAQQRLPNIEHVGIVPMQWQGEALPAGSLASAVELMGQQFYQTVEQAQRFRALDHELVKQKWATAEGRKELVDDYELDAFVVLSGQMQGETLRLTARLLGPDLKVYFTEMEPRSANRLATADKDTLNIILQDLVWRLFNRLPVDVTVTSVQSRYLSLSGGSNQGLKVGDELTIIRPSVQTLHPADQSWLGFSATVQGRARIVDLKSQSAVALLISQSFDGAVAVGDGLKIASIAGRKHFVEAEKKAELIDSRKDSVVLMTPDQQHAKAGSRKAPPVKTTMPNVAPRVIATPIAEQEVAPEDPESVLSDEQAEEQQTPMIAASASYEQMVRAADAPGRINFLAGIDMWNVGGKLKTKSTMAPWLFNTFAARSRFALNSDWQWDGRAQLGFGRTGKGNFTSLGISAKPFTRLPFAVGDGLQALRYGGIVGFSTVAVTEEPFGGADLLTGGGFFGLEGLVNLGSKTVLWHGDLSLSPIAIGQMGVAGSKKAVGNYLALGLELEALLAADNAESMQWGGAVELDSASLKAGSNLTTSSFRLMALLRYQL